MFRTLGYVFAVLALFGCGGGGGGGGPINTAPVSVATMSAIDLVLLGATVTFDGSASKDPEGSALRYEWRIEEKPIGSKATLSEPASVLTTLTPDVVGTYRVSLTTSDGLLKGSTVYLSVTARLNQAPIVVIDAASRVVVGSPTKLSAIRSTDPDRDPITAFFWSVVGLSPDGILTDFDKAESVFTPNEAGNYTIRAQVSDRFSSSTSDRSILVVKPYVASFSISKDLTIDFCSGPATLNLDTGIWVLKEFCELTTPQLSPKVWIRLQNNSAAPIAVKRIFIYFVCCTRQVVPDAPDSIVLPTSSRDYLIDLGIGPLGTVQRSFVSITLADGTVVESRISGKLALP